MKRAKLKPLLPSLREKKRYLAYEIISKDSLDLSADINEINESILDSAMGYLGSLGCAKAGIMVLKDKYNAKDHKGLIRVTHKSLDNLKSSLALITNIKKQEVIIRTIGVSGIMKKAYNYVSG